MSQKHPSKAEAKALKQGGNGRTNPWKGWRNIAQGERSEPWVDRRGNLKPPNGGDGGGTVFREDFSFFRSWLLVSGLVAVHRSGAVSGK